LCADRFWRTIDGSRSKCNPERPMSEPASPKKESLGRVTGVGGVFFKAKDPKVLAEWYRDVLGLPLESWGGAMLLADAPQHPPMLVWNAFKADTDYFAPSKRDYMINYSVDDMDAMLARLSSKGVEVIKRSDPNGRFAWIIDPEGNKIELWQPTASQ
jgi:predicted enzyme related to lactoylglutathione lyase